MIYTASKLIKIAEAELGYHEKASNSNLDSKTANSGNNNYQKYGRDLYKAGYYNGNKNGYQWCDQLVDWLFYQLCDKNKEKAEYLECQTGDLGAGCGFSMQYYKNAGRFDKNPKVGDQIFFRYSGNSGADHTGVVVKVTNSQIVTIEGNKNNKVSRCTYSRNYSCILGYGHPRYDAESAVPAKPSEPSKPVAVHGKIDTVKEVQIWLNNNYKSGLSGDGLYGKYTKQALTRALQKELGLNPDGIYGRKSKAAVKKNNLQKGSKGALVKVLQAFLVCHGYKSAYVDGSFGTGTQTALKAFQKAHNLTADGIAGSNTFAVLCG